MYFDIGRAFVKRTEGGRRDGMTCHMGPRVGIKPAVNNTVLPSSEPTSGLSHKLLQESDAITLKLTSYSRSQMLTP